jgi:FKBP-type peptidyl-prolyl cis-trans isomerase
VHRLRGTAALLASGALLITGCSSEDSSEDGAAEVGPCSYSTTVAGITVSGTTGEQASIEVAPDAEPATELIIEDLCDGDGDEVPAGATVTVDYVGVSQTIGAVFDSSFQRGTPATFGLNQVIQGWRDGLVGMQEGGTRLLIIPPDQAYGEISPSPDIAANDTLVFVVDMLDIA